MDFAAANLDINFNARSRSTGEGLAGTTNIGLRLALAFDLQLAYAFKVAAAAAANVATLTHNTGVVAQTTGTPVITDGDGKDWEGVALPASVSSKVVMVAIQAGASNAGTVTCAATDGSEAPAGVLRAGGLLLLAQPAATPVGAASTLGLTFSNNGDSVKVWVFDEPGA